MGTPRLAARNRQRYFERALAATAIRRLLPMGKGGMT
jgi:hypothetical protein